MGVTQGFIARDDSRREIVVAMRGSFSFMDIFTDIGVIPIPFTSPGVTAPSGAMVHAGFLTGWNSVAKIVLRSVGFQLQAHPGYSLVSTGHSLGGALASLAAMSFKANFPYTNVTVYTYGQPRTGNTVYAEWVNNELGGNVFRSVHTYDGVPTIIPTGMFPSLRDQAGTVKRAQNGYRHHGIEYWQNTEPASENATLRCADDGEDPDCSASIWSTGVNVAHFAYFGIPAIQPFCFKKVQTETYSSLRSTDAIQDLVDKHEGTNIGQDVAR
ncbi:alpha/beta-hydrolase [Ramaria rubella]|nr:alpha/beta-hydrolase [Ramaria rubella]